jgi:acetyl esterase/lipase
MKMKPMTLLPVLGLLLLACRTGSPTEPTVPPPTVTVTATALPRQAAKYGSVTRDVTYCQAGDVALKMDIYYPRQSGGKPAPVALNVHGGGWSSGDKADNPSEAPDIPELVARGYLVAAVNYRLSPGAQFPAMIEDVKCAVPDHPGRAGYDGVPLHVATTA